MRWTPPLLLFTNMDHRPVVGPLGRNPLGGRNWEGFGSDPYLSGELGYQSIVGTQSTGTDPGFCLASRATT